MAKQAMVHSEIQDQILSFQAGHLKDQQEITQNSSYSNYH